LFMWPAIVFFTDSPTYGLAKELSSLLNHLLENPNITQENFSDFAWSIAQELCILKTDEVMVSFDVVSLFTKAPIQLPLSTAKQHLQSNLELSQHTNLSTTELKDLN